MSVGIVLLVSTDVGGLAVFVESLFPDWDSVLYKLETGNWVA